MIVGDEAPGLAWVTLHYDMDIILHLCLTLTSKWGAAVPVGGGREGGRVAGSLRLLGLHFQVGEGEGGVSRGEVGHKMKLL